mmetsp:Transcript_105883/g.257242  ORF Transcript_105883/g.257242 Transcript_105883/m.257242 type:complete len:314 (-) Transcript_105883:33-974(-)
MLSHFLSYFLNTASTCCSSSLAEARVSKAALVFIAFSTIDPASRFIFPIFWRSCANICLVSSLPDSLLSTAFVLAASFMAGWFSRKKSEQVDVTLSTSFAASLIASEVVSTSCRLMSVFAVKESDFSFNSSSAFSAPSTSPFNSSRSFSAFSSISCFFLSSSRFFSSSFRCISFTASIRFWTWATTVSHSSWICCCLSPSLGSSLSKTSSSSLLASSKVSGFATRTFCCAFLISAIVLISSCLFSIASRLSLSSSSFFFFISSRCLFCSSAFRFNSAACSSFLLRLDSSTFFLFSSIFLRISSCCLRFSSRRC